MGWRRVLVAAGACMLASCAFQSGSRAGPPSVGGESSGIPLPGVREVDGKVMKVDKEQKLVRVLTSGGEMSLSTDGNTGVYQDGASVGLAALSEGSPVRASFVERDGQNVCYWIEIPRVPIDKNKKQPDQKEQKK